MDIHVGEDGRVVDTKLIVTAWVLDVTVSPSSVNEGEQFTVTVKRESDDELVNNADVTVIGLGTVNTGDDGSGTAVFTAPSDLSSDRDYTITVTADGYAADPVIPTVRVVNVPKIYINAPATGTVGTAFKVTAGGDDGNSFGMTVTIKDASGTEIDSKTTAGPDGVKFTISKAGTYTIEATGDGYAPADTKEIKLTKVDTPGFELLTLIAAIGVAFILLRRRRK